MKNGNANNRARKGKTYLKNKIKVNYICFPLNLESNLSSNLENAKRKGGKGSFKFE
jgi:hypothetical protein